MSVKFRFRHIVTCCLVLLWTYIAFVNGYIVIEPCKRWLDGELSFEQARDEISRGYRDDINEKYCLINLNGLYVKSSGGRQCNDVLMLKNGSLTSVIETYDTREHAKRVIELNNLLKDKEIDFIYVQSPFKVNSELLPYGVENEVDNNANIFLEELDGNVNYIDLRPYIVDSEEHINQYFYNTDHHWNPIGAFKGFQVISEYLQEQYPNEAIDGYYQNQDNWNINRKEDWFLGSRGKRTGIYFGGIDDLIWLTPKFETQMSCANVYRDDFFEGDYFEANIREEYISKRDYFELNAYCVYIGGDYPLVQHRNMKAPVDKKLLIIKDSFVLPLQTYFATVFSEVDVIDLRHYTAGTLYEYIEESNPDIVIMNLCGSALSMDEFFDLGLSANEPEGEQQRIFQSDKIVIEAESNEGFKYISVYGGIEAGKRYSLMCDTIDVVKGDTSGISVKLYDRTTQKVYDCSMWDIDYCNNKNCFSWTFIAPEEADNLDVLVYSGIAGQTNGNSVKLNNVRLFQE